MIMELEKLPVMVLLTKASKKTYASAQETTDIVMEKLTSQLGLESDVGIITKDPETGKIYKVHSKNTQTFSSGRKVLKDVSYDLLKDNELFKRAVSAMSAELSTYQMHNSIVKDLVGELMGFSIQSPDKLDMFQQWLMYPLRKYPALLREFELYDFAFGLMVLEEDLDETFSLQKDLKQNFVNHVETLFGMDLLFDF